jgi:metal-responsive CopG/Arc/MetJ family transcriptional regulator
VVAERTQFAASSPTKEERTAERVTVSLPARVADYVRGSAESRGEAVSVFIADALRQRQRRELAEAMMSGLLEDMEIDRQLVREWDETLPDTPE